METLSQMAILGASLSSRLNRTTARLPPLPVGKGPWTCCVTDSSLGVALSLSLACAGRGAVVEGNRCQDAEKAPALPGADLWGLSRPLRSQLEDDPRPLFTAGGPIQP